MRLVHFDFSSDPVSSQKTFCGYAGEHNETVLSVKLPERLVGDHVNEYRFIFCTADGNRIESPYVSESEGIVEIALWRQLTVAPLLKAEVAAYYVEDGETDLIGKTAPMRLYIVGEIDGNYTEASERGTLTISGMSIDEDGHLIVTYADGASDDLGKVTGGVSSVNGMSGDVTIQASNIEFAGGKTVSEALSDTQGELSILENNVNNSIQPQLNYATATAETANSTASGINLKIPQEASQSNKLADKAYVDEKNAKKQDKYVYGDTPIATFTAEEEITRTDYPSFDLNGRYKNVVVELEDTNSVASEAFTIMFYNGTTVVGLYAQSLTASNHFAYCEIFERNGWYHLEGFTQTTSSHNGNSAIYGIPAKYTKTKCEDYPITKVVVRSNSTQGINLHTGTTIKIYVC